VLCFGDGLFVLVLSFYYLTLGLGMNMILQFWSFATVIQVVLDYYLIGDSG